MPSTRTDMERLPAFTVNELSCPGTAALTPANSWMASSSCSVSVVTTPRSCLRAAEFFTCAGLTTSRFVPMFSVCRRISFFAPAPMALTTTTAPTLTAMLASASAARTL